MPEAWNRIALTENWLWHLNIAQSSGAYFVLCILGMQASKISLLLDALAKKSLCSTTDTYVPKGCYSYLNIKNKTLPWHSISGLPSSEVSLASSSVEGIYFSCFEPTDCTSCCRRWRSHSCCLCWAQRRSAPLGHLKGAGHELCCTKKQRKD